MRRTQKPPAWIAADGTWSAARLIRPRTLTMVVALVLALAVAAYGVGVDRPGAPALADSTDPPPRAPRAPGVFWGITSVTVSWEPVAGAAGYVVTIKANQSGQVKTYRNSIFPSNQAVIATSALPSGGAGGYAIRVRARAKNGKLSAFSSLPRIPATKIKNAVRVNKGDRKSAKKAAKVVSECTKDGLYFGAGTAAAGVIGAFIPGVNVTAAAIAGTVALTAGGTTFGCVFKKIDPLS